MALFTALKGDRIRIINHLKETYTNALADDVREGLSGARKTLPPKYFYDARGSKLFEEICTLPGYYPTRTEMKILREAAGEIMAPLDGCDLVELGSGANWKVKILLDAVTESSMNGTRYVPVDVSETALREAAAGLAESYPALDVACLVADFMSQLGELMYLIDGSGPKLFLFLGSTIGNFTEDEGRAFLKGVSRVMGPEDRLLLGLDMVKPRSVLEAAYTDPWGVTEDFNKNVLLVINRELGSNFCTDDFDHVAFFNEEKMRVEMHLRARRDLVVNITELDMTVTLSRGETIMTEICRKFTREGTVEMLKEGGLEAEKWFSDDRGWFSVAELKRAGQEKI